MMTACKVVERRLEPLEGLLREGTSVYRIVNGALKNLPAPQKLLVRPKKKLGSNRSTEQRIF
jgi:hypothetical protein